MMMMKNSHHHSLLSIRKGTYNGLKFQMNELPCEQDLFCESIFMLDNDFIDEHRKMSERRTAVQGSKKRPS